MIDPEIHNTKDLTSEPRPPDPLVKVNSNLSLTPLTVWPASWVFALFTQCPGDTVQTGTGKVDPSRKFKCGCPWNIFKTILVQIITNTNYKSLTTCIEWKKKTFIPKFAGSSVDFRAKDTSKWSSKYFCLFNV